jgi:hypothetical protein
VEVELVVAVPLLAVGFMLLLVGAACAWLVFVEEGGAGGGMAGDAVDVDGATVTGALAVVGTLLVKLWNRGCCDAIAAAERRDIAVWKGGTAVAIVLQVALRAKLNEWGGLIW